MKKLIEKLNELKIIQKHGDWYENISQDIWDEYFENKYKEVASDLNVDTRRWYETSITVLDFEGVFIGVRFITNMFSESQDYEDCYHQLNFFEMEEYPTVSYKKKEIKQ